MKLVALLAGLLLVASCEKEGGGTPGAAKTAVASSDEQQMLEVLPSGANALFGGNYMKLQDFMQSGPLKKLMAAAGQQSPGMDAWMKCWLELKDLRMLGVVKLSGMNLEMRMAMKGVTLANIEECSKRGNMAATVDADKKYISFDVPSAMGPMKTGYLETTNGVLYTRMALPIGGTQMPQTSRADLEGDIKGLSSGTAAKDPVLAEAMTRVDRTKSIWFVGSGANTPIADKVGLVAGTFDISNGIGVDASIQFKQATMVDELMKGFDQAKQQVGSMGGAAADVIKSITLTRNGEKVRFQMSMSNATLEKLLEQVGGLLPGAR